MCVKGSPAMLLVFSKLGWLAEKMSVSPLAGVPTKPQLALLSQLAFAPPAPDQLRTAAPHSMTPGCRRNTSTAAAASRLADWSVQEFDEREEFGINRFIAFIFPS